MGVATIGRRTRWAPPPHARIDWSHPLSQGLTGYWLPGVKTADFVSGTRATTTNGPTPVQTPLGVGMRFAGGSSQQFTCGTNSAWSPQTKLSLLAVYIPQAANAAAPLLMRDKLGTARGYQVYANQATTLDWAGANAGTGPFVTETPNAQGRESHLVFTADSTGPLQVLYNNGLLVDSDTGAFSTVAAAGENTTIGWRETGPSYAVDTVDIIVCAVWNRALPAGQVAALYADPFAMLVW